MKTTQIHEDKRAHNQDQLLDIIHKQECIISELRDENDALFFENETLKEKIQTISSVKESKKEKVNPDFSKSLTKLADELSIIQYDRDGPISKTEEKHLRVQAVGLALCILSGNKIGIEDICRHPAMVNLNPWYFQLGTLKKLNLPKKLLKEIVPLKVRTKGRKKKEYYSFHEIKTWQDTVKFGDTLNYYKENKPLPNTFQITENKLHMDIHRVKLVIDVWWEMVVDEYISSPFFHNILCLGYFGECKYELGYVFPNSMLGEWFDKYRE